EQVTAEVGYSKRQRYPQDFSSGRIGFIERYSQPIPVQEIVPTARIGLEMLKAYREASLEQQFRIYSDCEKRPWDNTTWAAQLYDGEPGRNMDEYLAEALPLLSSALRRKGISYNHVGTK